MFVHSFVADLDAILRRLKHGPPFALNRFADGELAILEGREIPTADGWDSRVDDKFRRRLEAALKYHDDDYFLGLSCPCCALGDFENLMARAGRTADDPNVTTSNIFVNGNYDRFLSSKRPSYSLIPGMGNTVNDDGRFVDTSIASLLDSDARGRIEPAFIAAGPATKIIIAEYWKRSKRRATVIDIGSALDPLLHGVSSRSYHDPNHPNRRKICQWKNPS